MFGVQPESGSVQKLRLWDQKVQWCNRICPNSIPRRASECRNKSNDDNNNNNNDNNGNNDNNDNNNNDDNNNNNMSNNNNDLYKNHTDKVWTLFQIKYFLAVHLFQESLTANATSRR